MFRHIKKLFIVAAEACEFLGLLVEEAHIRDSIGFGRVTRNHSKIWQGPVPMLRPAELIVVGHVCELSLDGPHRVADLLGGGTKI